MKTWASLLVVFLATTVMAVAQKTSSGQSAAGAQNGDTIFINEYRVEGASKLSRLKIEEAVYPFLGPGRTKEDVEQARATLEKVYFEQGYQTVAVQIPPQQVAGGIVRLVVIERPVGRLRVKGARYSVPSQIKTMAPSLAEGTVINFNEVPSDIIGLNRLPERQITPALRAGAAPDTVDVDLTVKETAPLHASVEVNNRHGPDTTPQRVNVSVSASNLWQAGHAASFSFQTSPQNRDEVKVFSGYYLARFRQPDWLSLMFLGTKQDSNVSTLGDVAVAGRGQTAGLRAMISLPGGEGFVQSAEMGIDYKHFKQKIQLGTPAPDGTSEILTPITYFPLTAAYSANWIGKRATTEFNGSVTLHLRGLGSTAAEFGNNRFNADGSFIYFRGDLSHTRELPGGFQVFGKVQGQLANQPLLSQEQATGGGWGTVRGYLEAEEAGDSSAFGTLELRSPSLTSWLKAGRSDWRIYVFGDAGWLKVIDPLPGQKNHFDFASYGIGSRLRLLDHFDGSITASLPQLTVGRTKAQDRRITFKVGLDY